jgi:sulfur-oxidizing protein SoxZ
LFPAIAANPFLAFSAVADASGTLVMRFVDDEGKEQTETVEIAVE